MLNKRLPIEAVSLTATMYKSCLKIASVKVLGPWVFFTRVANRDMGSLVKHKNGEADRIICLSEGYVRRYACMQNNKGIYERWARSMGETASAHVEGARAGGGQ